MKITTLIIVTFLCSLSSCELPPPKKSYAQPNWLSKQQLPQGPASQRTIIIQIRSDSGVPKLLLKRAPNRLQQGPPRYMRPIKFAVSPQFLLKQNAIISKHARKPSSITKLKFNHPKAPTGYVYEKPFAPTPQITKQPIENNNHLIREHHFGPIHTIPAPNLGTGSGFAANHFHFNDHRFENHNLHHQYQVTEEQSNDQTIHDPLSGQTKYFAPDPDPSLPARKIRPSSDPFSMPSNGKPLPIDVQHNYLSPVQSTYLPPAHKQIQSPGTSYGAPFGNSVQLQNLVEGMPLSVYNPSYLVSQSKNLYNQHQQQLFKPENSYASPSTTYGSEDLTQEVASDGQILQAAKDAVSSVPVDFNGLQNISPQLPTYAALVAQPQSSAVTESYETHSIQPDPSQAFNFGNAIGQGGFVVSNFFGAAESDLHHQFSNHQQPFAQHHQQFDDLSQQQLQNQETLEKANQQLQQQLYEHGTQEYATNQNIQQEISAYEQHQQLLQQQLGGSSPLRIFVPDEEYQQSNPSNLQKRSDDYSGESSDVESKEGELEVASSAENSIEHKANEEEF